MTTDSTPASLVKTWLPVRLLTGSIFNELQDHKRPAAARMIPDFMILFIPIRFLQLDARSKADGPDQRINQAINAAGVFRVQVLQTGQGEQIVCVAIDPHLSDSCPPGKFPRQGIA